MPENEENLEENMPSMEDILKSIRGVITNEESSSGDEKEGDESDQPLDLGEPLELGDPIEEKSETTEEKVTDSSEAEKDDSSNEASVLDSIDSALSEGEEGEANWDEALAEAEAGEKEEAKTETDAAPESKPKSDSESLLEDETASKTSATIKELMSSLPKDEVESPVSRGGTSLEDLVIEAMRPMLADWLNENLDTVVKNLVSKEIKKIIPRDDE